MDNENGPAALDGNAAAGALAQIFLPDVTVAQAVCRSCGRKASFGECHLYGGQMGHVLRCLSCDAVLMRMVKTPRGFWLEMEGLRSLHFPDAR